MKKLLCIVSVMMAMMLMAGCRHVSQMNLLVEAETFLPAEPDSADVRLRMVDVQQLDGDEEEAFYALLRTMTDVMQGATRPNDTLVNRAYSFYRQKSKDGTSSDQALVKHYAQSAMYMGDWYAANDSIKASEDCYRKAIKYSEKAEDWHTCYIAYERLAEQVQWNNIEDALQMTETAIDIYSKIKDNPRNLVSLYEYAANYASQIADTQNSNNFQQALSYASKAYTLTKDSCLTDYYDQIHLSLADIFWMMGDYHKALDYVRNIRLKDLSSELSLTTNMKIAQYYLSCDSILKAKELYKLPKVISDKTLTYLYARGLSEVAAHQLNKDSIIFYMDSAFTASEAMFLDALQAKDEYYHDNLEKERKNEELLYKDKLKTWGFGTLAFILLIVVSFTAWVMTLKLRMHREKLSNAQEEMALMKEKQAALEDSQQKKAATIKYLQRYIIDQAEVTSHLKDTTTHVKMSAKNWNDVEQLLDEIDDGRVFKIRARFKNLSVDDIRLCIMVRLGMSNPAIGNVYGITPSAVQHRKLALKKKGFGITDPEVTLDRFLESL